MHLSALPWAMYFSPTSSSQTGKALSAMGESELKIQLSPFDNSMLLKQDGLPPLVSFIFFPLLCTLRLHEQQTKLVQFLSPGIKGETSCCAKTVSWQFGELSWLTLGSHTQEGEGRSVGPPPPSGSGLVLYLVKSDLILCRTVHKNMFLCCIYFLSENLCLIKWKCWWKWKVRAHGRDLMALLAGLKLLLLWWTVIRERSLQSKNTFYPACSSYMAWEHGMV